jgi:flagellar basal-body rod protein FlgG
MSQIAAAVEVGMLSDAERLRIISHNLANVGTVGYKRELAIVSPFEAQMLRTTAGGRAAGAASVSAQGLVASFTDRSPGTLTYTGNPLDLALEGDAYFVIDTGSQEAYTRQGTLQINSDGQLVNVAGQSVVTTGGDVRLTTPAPSIDGQGNIRDNGTVVGQLKLVTVANPDSLVEIGNGMHAATNSTMTAPADSARVRQGFTEAANVVSMNEMVGMLETVRHFETSQKLLQGYDAMLDRAITDLGNVQ